jgi:hypothetical protein
MPLKIDLKFRIASAICLALSLLSALAWLAPSAAPTAASAQTGGSLFVRRIPIKANDIVYSSSTNLFYASIPSSVGAGGNSIESINPLTGDVGNPVFIGSEPDRLAISSDGNTIYAFLSGAFSLRRFDVQTQRPGVQFGLGQSFFQETYNVNDLAVAPGEPGVVAVVRYYMGVSPPEAGVAIFDNGVQRQKTGADHISGSDFVAYSASASRLYGAGNFDGLRTMTIDPTGVAGTTFATTSVGARIKVAGGLVYGSSGKVMNPDTGTLLGTFSDASSFAFVPDAAAGRVYYLNSDFFNSSDLTLRAYDVNTFLPVGSQSISGVSGTPTNLVRWGANGLAFCTSAGEVYILQTSLIPSGSPIPTPTPTPSSTPTPTPTPVAASVHPVPLLTNSIAYNAARQELYATLPSAAGASGNSVARINTATGAVESPIFVGSEPNRMAFSDDGQTMYVILNGALAARRVNLQSQAAGLQFSIGANTGSVFPDYLAVMPGAADTVAISRSNGETAIYDNGVKRPHVAGGPGSARDGDALQFGLSPTRLYSGGGPVQKMTVSPEGVFPAGTSPAGTFGPTTYFDKARGLLFNSGGDVIDPEAGAILGRFTGLGFESLMAVDSAAGRVYFLTSDFFFGGWKLVAYDMKTYLPVGFANITGFSGTPTNLVRWGSNGFAFRTGSGCCPSGDGQLVLVETELVSAPQPVLTGVALASASLTARESDATLAVNVTRTGDLSGPTTVSYATSDYTAVAGSDYVATSGTLTFAPGEATKSFNVAVSQDNLYEGDEALTVTLSNPTGGALLAGPASAFVTIDDDETPPVVSIADLSRVEGNFGTSQAQFLVSLSSAAAVPVSVNYATSNGTASSPGDFTAASGVLTIPALTTSAQVNVNVVGDLQVEPDETFTVTLSNPVNSSLGRAQATGTIVNDDVPLLNFSSTFYDADETSRQVVLTVRRIGDASAPASVNYTTSDGTASETSDYTLTLGTLRFAAGEAEKQLTVLINDDAFVEPDETFIVSLSSPSGGSLGTPATAFVTLHSDDVTPGPNPVGDGFDAAFFVRQHYHDFLNREPDASGLAFWVNQTTNCGNPNLEVCRVNVSAAFFKSIEFQETGYLVERTYKTAFGDATSPNVQGTVPVIRLNEFLSDTQEIGRGIVVGQGNWQAQLEANKVAYFNGFVTRARFSNVAPPSLSPAQFVDALFVNAGVTPTAAERQAAADEFGGASNTADTAARARALRQVAENPTLSRSEFNRAFVLMEYFGYLRRNPNNFPEPTLNYAGWKFWLDKLNQFNGDFVKAEMVKAFITSDEYRHRFGQ